MDECKRCEGKDDNTVFLENLTDRLALLLVESEGKYASQQDRAKKIVKVLVKEADAEKEEMVPFP